MAFNKDSTVGTIAIVTAMCLACSVVVSMAAVGLRPLQNDNKLLDAQGNILSVAGFSIDDIKKTYGERIDARLVDLAAGNYVEGDASKFNAVAALKNPALSTPLRLADDKAGLRVIAKQSPVYLAKNEAGDVETVILPVYGRGLWSTMYAFVALATDGNTIKGITYYQHGETPGLGGEIQNPLWSNVFKGKTLFDADGKFAFKVIKGTAAPDAQHEVDGLSGATLTANGVQNTFAFWMGPQGFGPFLDRLKSGEAL